MADQRELLRKMKALARERGLRVTWKSISAEFRDEIDSLYNNSRRRLRANFEGWVTRERMRSRDEVSNPVQK